MSQFVQDSPCLHISSSSDYQWNSFLKVSQFGHSIPWPPNYARLQPRDSEGAEVPMGVMASAPQKGACK